MGSSVLCLILCLLWFSDVRSYPSKPLNQVLFTYSPTDIEWDPDAGAPRNLVEVAARRPRVPEVTLEVRRAPVPGTNMTMRALFLKERILSKGHLVGCYTGVLRDEEDESQKNATSPSMGAYTYHWNETHVIDPTDDRGEIPETGSTPLCAMAFVNEPGRGLLPNIVMVDDPWCKDTKGRVGIPFYAFRTILPGDEVLGCYGKDYTARTYETVCASDDFDRYLNAMRADIDDILLGEQNENVKGFD